MKCAIFLIAYSLALASASIPVEDRLRLGDQIDLADAPDTDSESKMTRFELPKDLTPINYVVHLDPDLGKATFDGKVSITVQAGGSTNFIILNAKHIKLSGEEPVKVTRISLKRLEKLAVTKTSFDVPNEQLTIELAKALSPKASYVVEITYTGLLGKDMMGFYLSRYTNKAGKEKLLASTQFEPTGARRAFPCFDQPNYKTPFTIVIKRNKVQKSISNMPLRGSEDVPNTDKVIDTFEVSPHMPTYLVGFAVFEFGFITSRDGKFRVWGREDVIQTQGQYIFEKGQKILQTLSDYMGIDYYSKMPKMDLVAVPDFDAGAMENWGMNTYREMNLLADETRTKAFGLEDISRLVSHALSQQWFGNLVTPATWDSAWLKDSFATFFQFKVVDLVEPTWRMEDLFVVEQVQTAFNSDLKGSHAMTSKTTTPESIASTFDHIIYNKGGSVLRMIENAVTPTVFQEALRNYLTTGSSATLQGTVEPSNLWDAFDEVIFPDNALQLPKAAESITDFTYEWVNSPGFPLVTFKRNYTNNIITITQQRFFNKKADMDADNTKWTIPVTYLTQEDVRSGDLTKVVQHLVWFPKTVNKIEIKPSLKASDWYYGNVKEVGFYRVNYDDKNWELLTTQLITKHSDIQVLNRAQILDDAFTLAKGGHIKMQQALELTRYLRFETDFIPWYAVWSHLRALMNLYADTELGRQMKTYFIYSMTPIFEKLGLEDKTIEDNMSKLGRSSIAVWICHLGHGGCVNEAASKFRTWIQAPESSNIPPNIKDAVYCSGIKLGTDSEWDKLWNYYLKTDLASEQVAVLYALGCSQNENKLTQFLNQILDPKSPVRAQDHYIVIRAVVGDRAGVKAALKFIPAKAELMLREAKEDEQSPAEENLKSIISALGASIRNQDELTEFTKVLDSLKLHTSLFSTINRTLTHTEERFAVRAAHQATLTTFFAQNTPSTTPSPSTSTPYVSTSTPKPGLSSSTPATGASTPKPNSASLSQISVYVLLTSVLAYLGRVVC